MGNKERDTMGERLDSTRKELDALRLWLTGDAFMLEHNPHLVFKNLWPRILTLLDDMHDTHVLLDYRLDQLERRDS